MLKCTLCNSDARRTFKDGSTAFPFCDTCIGGLSDAKSAMGRVLRRWAKHAIRRIAQRLHADYMATPEHLKRARDAQRRNRDRPENQLKIKARTALRNAMLRGKIVRPDACQRCGETPEPILRTSGKQAGQLQCQIWFHHTHGYEREFWLIGEWLCKHCHMVSERSPSTGPKLRPRMPPYEPPALQPAGGHLSVSRAEDGTMIITRSEK